MRETLNELQCRSIGSITASGFSGVLGVLACLNIGVEEMYFEMVGLEALVETVEAEFDEQKLNIVELLARKVDTQEKLYYQGTGKRMS